MGLSGVCYGGSGEGSTLVELLGVDVGAAVGSTVGVSDGNRYGKI